MAMWNETQYFKLTLAALCQPPYSPYGAFSLLRCLFSSRSSATCQIGLLSPVKFILLLKTNLLNNQRKI